MLDSLLLQIEIVQALAFREQRQRIRKSPFGAVGLLLEPYLGMAAWLVLRTIIRARGSDWMNPALQFGCAFILFYLFSKIALGAFDGIARMKQVLSLRRVNPIDTLIAGAVVETQIYSTCMIILIFIVSIFEWKNAARNPGESVLIIVLIAAISFGVGLASLVIGHLVSALKLLINLVIRRVLFWTSGLFFSVETIPDYIRPWITWNPLLHGIELFRHSLQPLYPIPGISMGYLVIWGIGSIAIGMIVYTNNKELLLKDA